MSVSVNSGALPTYSLAFERLVNGPDDLAGLIAYAVYKQSINEKAKAGQPRPERQDRILSDTDVKTFREAADRRLQDFATSAINEAREDIIATGTGLVIQAAKAEIIERVTTRTSVGNAILVSLAGWYCQSP